MLVETTRNDDLTEAATQRCNIVATLFRMVTTLFSIATLCCVKNHRYELFRSTSP